MDTFMQKLDLIHTLDDQLKEEANEFLIDLRDDHARFMAESTSDAERAHHFVGYKGCTQCLITLLKLSINELLTVDETVQLADFIKEMTNED